MSPAVALMVRLDLFPGDVFSTGTPGRDYRKCFVWDVNADGMVEMSEMYSTLPRDPERWTLPAVLLQETYRLLEKNGAPRRNWVGR